MESARGIMKIRPVAATTCSLAQDSAQRQRCLRGGVGRGGAGRGGVGRGGDDSVHEMRGDRSLVGWGGVGMIAFMR